MKQGFKEYINVMNVSPNVILISSNFWDLANWLMAADYKFTGSMTGNEMLPLQQWKQNMTKVLSYVKVYPFSHSTWSVAVCCVTENLVKACTEYTSVVKIVYRGSWVL